MQQIRLFFIALQFFTRLPIPAWVGFEAAWLQHASRYFPLVGCVVGVLAAATYFAASLVLPAPVAAVLSSAASIYLTGAFHEDGFADTCDGLGGGTSRERVLEIMKDSRVGAYGAIGIVCMLAAKLSALAMLPPRVAIAALLLAHPLSRLAATALIWKLDYVRGEGKAKPLAQHMTGGEFGIAAATCLLPAAVVLASGWVPAAAVLAAALAAMLAALWLGRKLVRRIGGYTGDCLGAVQQLAEVAIYIALLATLGHGAWV
ncbi:adenosylcobinamide-GDP ribazoletransferase [Massilia terrae]|uniref:Adenosylcobinamide-GDP ribazoletransferase n=1 Tax=Massilia terrae TaxID=1811224 RepID=A0ABT2CYJ3_9BURK|nr:adenosylcobinamide-GDP ribazoletransferase [Massilia terrae]MCS0659054.1 adenosylcobinamide-GDP ribazoletransferase [Massilia terrae]